MLDSSEYLHLAIHASESGDHHAALNYLNQALTQDPNNASLIYFQAAEHAELGLFERASKGITQALAIDETLDVARFQLGLLHLQLQQTELAQHQFATLTEKTNDPSLKSFSKAYLALINENVESATELLEAGIASCESEPLKADMQRVLASLAESPVTEEASDHSAMYLGAYRDTFDKNS
ncbi:MAG: hypothetical protein C0508_23005 [Cyanobacteria bacterium PR.023]|nr:hypothetical protein [Cyanobacteria bacterium PR.023]